MAIKRKKINGTNYLSKINDIFRCRIVARYMDGPSHIISGLSRQFTDQCTYDTMDGDRGYYAWHCGVIFNLLFGGASHSKIKLIPVCLEIQIVTQLSDALNSLTHRLYEDVRINGEPPAGWEWQSEQLLFKTAYMGHTIHMLDGALVELKNKPSGEEI